MKVKINKKIYSAKEGDTILDVAKKNDIEIPHLCVHPDFPVKGNCRVCVVEVKGAKRLMPSCATKVVDGMEVLTESERVQKSRNMNLELIFAEHVEKCATCPWRFECPLLNAVKKYNLKLTRFRDRKGNRKIRKFRNAVEIDGSQCIDCGNCIDACSLMQDINFLKFSDKGYRQEITTRAGEGFKCILCGQCTIHCPVSAAQEQYEVGNVEKILKEKKDSGKVLVAQFAPSVRVAIGEDFGMPYGKDTAGRITAALKQLGFDYVFDVNFGADVTTIVEAEELLERLGQKKPKLPMFTACCPGWVNYVELYRPDLIPNLTTSRSPHMHLGGIVKTHWAKSIGIKPENIELVSVMPCTAKKFEARRPEMKIGKIFAIDHVLTTRELSFLFKKNNIDLAQIKPAKINDPMGGFTGGAALFGGSGGVMESALRTAAYFACSSKKGKACVGKIDYGEVRGLSGIKEATVKVNGKNLRIAVVNGISNIKPILASLEKYDYIEVMACPGGCIGGGGQPFPIDDEIRKKRIEALYKIDFKNKLRKSYENEAAMDVVEWLKKNKLNKKVVHTKYKKRSY